MQIKSIAAGGPLDSAFWSRLFYAPMDVVASLRSREVAVRSGSPERACTQCGAEAITHEPLCPDCQFILEW